VPAERASQVIAMLLGMKVSAGWVDKAAARVSAQLRAAGSDDAMIAALAAPRNRTGLPIPGRAVCWLTPCGVGPRPPRRKGRQ